MSLHYTALKNADLKSTTVTLIHKFWDAQLKDMGITYQGGEPGVKATIEQVGADHFVRTFQPYAVDDEGNAVDGYEIFSLGELAASREAESELVQFDVISSRVDAFLSDAKLGLLRTKQLYEAILMAELPDGNAIIAGGRHRATGLLTAYKLIEGWQEVSVAVKVRTVKSMDEAVNLITASNGSRTMTNTEKAQLTSARRGISVVRSPEELVDQLVNLHTAADIKNVAMLYYVAKGSEQLDNVTNDTLGKIGNSVMTNLTKAINTLGKGAALKVFNFKGADGTKIAKGLIEYTYQVMFETWDDLMDSIKEPIRDRKTGGHKVDENGNTVFSINVARSTASIAKDVSDSVFAQLEPKLKTVFDTAVKAEEAEKAEKAAQSTAKKATQQVNKVESAMDYLVKMGIQLTAEQQALIDKTKREAEEQAKQLAEQPAQNSSKLALDLETLLA